MYIYISLARSNPKRSKPGAGAGHAGTLSVSLSLTHTLPGAGAGHARAARHDEEGGPCLAPTRKMAPATNSPSITARCHRPSI